MFFFCFEGCCCCRILVMEERVKSSQPQQQPQFLASLSLNSLWWESRPNKSTWTQDNSGALSWLKPSQQRRRRSLKTHTQPTNHQNHCVHCASQDGVCRRVRNHLKATAFLCSPRPPSSRCRCCCYNKIQESYPFYSTLDAFWLLAKWRTTQCLEKLFYGDLRFWTYSRRFLTITK